MAQLSLFNNTCTCGTRYESCTQPNKDCPEFQIHKLTVLERAQIQLKSFYRVRMSNLYSRTANDTVKRYPTEKEAVEALENWKKKAVGNTGIIICPLNNSLEA